MIRFWKLAFHQKLQCPTMQKAGFILARLKLLSAMLTLMIFPNTGALLWYFIIFEAILQIISQFHLKLLYEYVLYKGLNFYFTLLESHLITVLCRNCSSEGYQSNIPWWSRPMGLSVLFLHHLSVAFIILYYLSVSISLEWGHYRLF